MFIKKIAIIYLTKEKLKFALIKLDKEPKILKSDEIDWNKDSLGESFKKAKKQLKTKTIRLLLADDLSDILQLNIPFNSKPTDERELVEAKIKLEIPEILESENWDFKETGRKTQSDKQIIAFAPVKASFSLISQALVDAGLKVEALEPEAISKIRHENPLIGLALKTNLEPSRIKGSELPESSASTNVEDSSEPKNIPKPKITKTFIIIFLTTLALGALLAGGILVQRNALESLPSPSPSPVIVTSPEPIFSPTPIPSPEPKIVLSDYQVQVLNGTGGKGVASTVKTILEAEGFETVKADNASKLDHLKTTIQFKANTPDAVYQVIERSLNSDYDLVKSEEVLTEDSEYDVIITVGQIKEN